MTERTNPTVKWIGILLLAVLAFQVFVYASKLFEASCNYFYPVGKYSYLIDGGTRDWDAIVGPVEN